LCFHFPVPRKELIRKEEKEICDRLKKARVARGQARWFLASTAGIDSDSLKRIELGRVPLRYSVARWLIPFLDLNPIWLLTGTGEMHGSIPLPSEADLKASESALFSEVFREKIWHVLKTAPETDSLKSDSLARFINYQALCAYFKAYFRDVPNGHVQEFTKEMLAYGTSLFEALPQDDWKTLLQRRERFNRFWEELNGSASSNNPSLTRIHVSVNTSDVKAQWPLLKKRLQRATAETGSKSRLAEFLGAKLASVSQWLTDSDNAREPGADTALRMLQWVERQER
jgi:transcriptional regulator with XRE-family HTH domain